MSWRSDAQKGEDFRPTVAGTNPAVVAVFARALTTFSQHTHVFARALPTFSHTHDQDYLSDLGHLDLVPPL